MFYSDLDKKYLLFIDSAIFFPQLMLFKMVSILFPTSDFRHRVTTSAMIFMCMTLGQSPVNHGRDIVAGLFMCNVCLEVRLSFCNLSLYIHACAHL